MQKRTIKIVSRSVTSLAMGMALTVGSASLASAGGDHHIGGKNHDVASGKISSFDYAKGGNGGYVTAVTSTSVTVLQWDGTSATYTLTPTTTYTEGKTPSTSASLVVGDRVKVGTASSAPATATSVNIELAQLFGTVKSISGNTITISDPQGFSRTIVVSSATAYTNAGAAGTLANVVVGSKIAAQGTIDANLTSLDALSVAIGTAGHVTETQGTITAVTSSSVTVQGKDNTLTTFTYTPTTSFVEGSLVLSASNLSVGESVGVEFDSSAATTALKVEVRPTFEAGSVTAISGNTISIKDFQGAPHTIVVSSATTYDLSGNSGNHESSLGKNDTTPGSLTNVIVGAKIFASGVLASDGTTLDAQKIIIAPATPPVPVPVPVTPSTRGGDHGNKGNHGDNDGDNDSNSANVGIQGSNSMSVGIQSSNSRGSNDANNGFNVGAFGSFGRGHKHH
ncbi:MAG TPA: DUF5666 domain-containing protein [Acidimicrobiales bacterium]